MPHLCPHCNVEGISAAERWAGNFSRPIICVQCGGASLPIASRAVRGANYSVAGTLVLALTFGAIYLPLELFLTVLALVALGSFGLIAYGRLFAPLQRLTGIDVREGRRYENLCKVLLVVALLFATLLAFYSLFFFSRSPGV